MAKVLYEKPLKIELSDDYKLIVNGKPHAFEVRRVSAMKDVLKDAEESDWDAYFMYRDVFKKQGMRFDITIIPAKTIGTECAKTYGHTHPVAEEGLSFPEIYEVLVGSAIFLLQKNNSDGSVDVELVEARKGEVVLIAPNWSHVTINPGKEEKDILVLSNAVADCFNSDYSDFKNKKGAGVYYLADKSIENNPNYTIRKLERVEGKRLNRMFDFVSDDILHELDAYPEKFEFLKKPSLLSKR